MSLLQPSSATGNPRNKTALKPGHSLMDWIRLGNSHVDLTGVGGKRILVTKDQLAAHNKKDDVWMCIRGIVYNVTRYLDFHPGGREELMRGAGIDATELFNKVHPWVNYESMLQKCIVGKLSSILPDENPFVIPSSKKPTQTKLQSMSILRDKSTLACTKTVDTKITSKSFYSMDWFQQLKFVCLVFYLKSSSPKISILLNENCQDLRLNINEKSLALHLEQPVKWPFQVKVNISVGKIQVQLDKQEPKVWNHHSTSSTLESVNVPTCKYNSMKLVKHEQVLHNVSLLTFEYCSQIFHYVPVGHHVFIKLKVDDVHISKPYTPVEPLQRSLVSYSNTLSFLIKRYPDGVLSPLLCGLTVGQEIEVAGADGKFDVSLMDKRSRLLLLVAGTGLTPMIPLLNWALQNQRQEIQLMFFNKTEQDIIWREELDNFASENPKFSIEHVLSEPTSTWNRTRGHISTELLLEHIPTRSSDLPVDTFVCVCGPIGFNQSAERCLSELSYTQDDYFCFSG